MSSTSLTQVLVSTTGPELVISTSSSILMPSPRNSGGTDWSSGLMSICAVVHALLLRGIDWEGEFLSCPIDECVSFFNETVYALQNQYIPIKCARNYSYPVWYNSALIKAIKEKITRNVNHKLFIDNFYTSLLHGIGILPLGTIQISRAKGINKSPRDHCVEKSTVIDGVQLNVTMWVDNKITERLLDLIDLDSAE
ncbi:unnamed protein product [Leptidea sinapis]|uniref:PiggyBac transposable element-derived protein domain-containing protein n=1 Tax=Leptidea sinapis TaxID=189913 RepID=A0A5E4Q5A5_9NEOP|nr:unnamed protein product [Leptidea sinapis]